MQALYIILDVFPLFKDHRAAFSIHDHEHKLKSKYQRGSFSYIGAKV